MESEILTTESLAYHRVLMETRIIASRTEYMAGFIESVLFENESLQISRSHCEDAPLEYSKDIRRLRRDAKMHRFRIKKTFAVCVEMRLI